MTRFTSSTRARACLMLALLAPTIVGVGAQQAPAGGAQQPVFRSGTRLVVQNVTVKDKDGKPVEGLTAADFIVTEDNAPQDVTFVEYQRLLDEAAVPLTTAAPLQTVPDGQAQSLAATPAAQQQISTPPGGGVRYQDRRLLVFYFDLSTMGQAEQFRSYDNAMKYITTQMTASDLIAIMAFKNGAVRVRSDFTDNREKLLAQIQLLAYNDDINGDGIPDVADGGTPFGQDDGEFNLFNTDRQLSALQTAVTMLKPLPEQKALIYFAGPLQMNGADNQAQMRATENAAIKANVKLYPIDARGLVAMAPMGNATQTSAGGGGMALFTGRAFESMMGGFQRSQDALYALGKDTGGKAMLDNNDLSLGIQQAARDVSSYYILGFQSTHTNTDGKFRRVKIELRSSQSGHTLSYRQGYYAEKSYANFNSTDKARQLEEALGQEDPITEVPMAVEVNYFQLNSADYFVPIAIKIPGSELTLARKKGAARAHIDLIGVIKDDSGYTIQNISDSIDMKLSAETAAQFETKPIVFDVGYTILPGKYVLKVLTRDTETGRIGTFQTPFVVPNLEKEKVRVPISSVVLSSQRMVLGQEIYNASGKNQAAAQATNPLVFSGEKLIPSVTRVFNRGRDLHVFLQSYQRGLTTQEPLVAFVTFYRGEEKVYETTPLPVTDGMNDKKIIPLRFSIPLASFEPGRYECQVTVLNPGSKKVAFWRGPITVTP